MHAVYAALVGLIALASASGAAENEREPTVNQVAQGVTAQLSQQLVPDVQTVWRVAEVGADGSVQLTSDGSVGSHFDEPSLAEYQVITRQEVDEYKQGIPVALVRIVTSKNRGRDVVAEIVSGAHDLERGYVVRAPARIKVALCRTRQSGRNNGGSRALDDALAAALARAPRMRLFHIESPEDLNKHDLFSLRKGSEPSFMVEPVLQASTDTEYEVMVRITSLSSRETKVLTMVGQLTAQSVDAPSDARSAEYSKNDNQVVRSSTTLVPYEQGDTKQGTRVLEQRHQEKRDVGRMVVVNAIKGIRSMAAIDVNGDGRSELAVINEDEVGVLRIDRSTVAKIGTHPYRIPENTIVHVTAGDIDHDGIDEMAIARITTSSHGTANTMDGVTTLMKMSGDDRVTVAGARELPYFAVIVPDPENVGDTLIGHGGTTLKEVVRAYKFGRSGDEYRPSASGEMVLPAWSLTGIALTPGWDRGQSIVVVGSSNRIMRLKPGSDMAEQVDTYDLGEVTTNSMRIHDVFRPVEYSFREELLPESKGTIVTMPRRSLGITAADSNRMQVITIANEHHGSHLPWARKTTGRAVVFSVSQNDISMSRELPRVNGDVRDIAIGTFAEDGTMELALLVRNSQNEDSIVLTPIMQTEQ